MKSRKSLVIATALCLVVLFVLPVTAQEKFRESYTARVLWMGTTNPPIIPSGVTTTMQITITRWTTDEERNLILGTLIEKGHADLVKVLQKQEETGWIRVTGRGANLSSFPSQRLRYAREFRDGNKRTLVLALDREIPFFEAVQGARTLDYDLSLITLDLDEEGKGQGQLALGVKLSVDHENKRFIIETFGTEPMRLTSVTMNK